MFPQCNMSAYIFLIPVLLKVRVTQMLVLDYLLPLVSNAAPCLVSVLSGTFPLALMTNIGKYNSDAASSGQKELPPGDSIA